MDNSLLWLFMFLLAALLAGLPSGYFALAGMVMDATSTSAYFGLVAFLLIFMFLGTFGFGTLLQSTNCGGVKDMKRVAQNAGIATGIMSGFLLIPVVKIPWLSKIMSGLIYGSTGSASSVAAADLGYWGFWGGLYGFAVGGTLAMSC
jgi:hypothetical protein